MKAEGRRKEKVRREKVFYQNNMGLKPHLLTRNIFGAKLKSPTSPPGRGRGGLTSDSLGARSLSWSAFRKRAGIVAGSDRLRLASSGGAKANADAGSHRF